MKKYSLLFIFLFISNVLFAQAGIIDSSFGTFGIVTTSVTYNSSARSVALQSDGKIVASGTVQTGPNNYNIGLARYNTDGSLDQGFGQQGIMQANFILSPVWAHSLMIQPDGKIVIAGGTPEDFALARYNINSTSDVSFGIDGTGTVISGIGPGETAALQPDGKIVMWGYNSILVRFTSDGIVDSSFGINGLDSITDVGYVTKIIVQPDSKIITGGFRDNYFALTRFNLDGTLDNTFGTGGMVNIEEGDYVVSLALQADGKILASGGSNGDFALLVRFNNNGTLDGSFGENGMVTMTTGSAVYSIALQSDNKIIGVGGSFVSNSNDAMDFNIIRWNSNGSVDSSFGVNGIFTTDILDFDGAGAVAIQTDGKIIAAGGSQVGGFFTRFALVRYLSGLNVGIIDFSVLNNSVFIYPNPVTETAVLEYSLKDQQTISIRLVNIQGELLKTFIENENQETGEYKVNITFPDWLSSGSYFIVISTGIGKQVSIKIIK